MNVLPVGIALCLVSVHAFAAGNSSLYTGLTDLNQNPAFRPKLQVDLFIERLPLSSSLPKYARVTSVVDLNDKIGFEDNKHPMYFWNATDHCKSIGFNIRSCPPDQYKVRACPYNNDYYQRCCHNSYRYHKSECSYPNTISSDSCGGKHRCYCDTAQYPFASCDAPRIKGEACSDDNGTRYAACVCPEDNNGPWGCKEYYPAPCASVCKTPYPDNCHKREDVALPQNSYCSEHYDDCASKCRSWVCQSGYTNISDCAWMKCWIKL